MKATVVRWATMPFAMLLLLCTRANAERDDEPVSRAVSTLAIELSGWTQIDAVAWSADSRDEFDPTTGAPLNQERLVVRRARLRAAAARGAFDGSLEIDGNTVDGSALRLLAAEVRWRYRRGAVHTELSAGLFKIPFGIEVPLPDRQRVLLEPSRAARALFPGSYDAGVMLTGGWQMVRWAVAISNGAPVGEPALRGRDPSAAVDVVGRVGARSEGCGWSVSAGLSGLLGQGLHPGDPPTKDQLVWVDSNENGLVEATELQVVDGDPGTPSQRFDHRAVGLDVGASWWLPGLGWGKGLAEIVVAQNLDRGLLIGDPIAQSRDLRELGWHFDLEQQVTNWALIAVRYDRYQPDRDASEVLGTELIAINPTWSTWTVVAGLTRDPLRLLLGYEHERNPLGRGDDGRPTTRTADRMTLRGQIGF